MKKTTVRVSSGYHIWYNTVNYMHILLLLFSFPRMHQGLRKIETVAYSGSDDLPRLVTLEEETTNANSVRPVFPKSQQRGGVLSHSMQPLQKQRRRLRTSTTQSRFLIRPVLRLRRLLPRLLLLLTTLHCALPLPIARAEIAAHARCAGIIPTAPRVAFGCEPSFAVFAPVDDVL